jgi:hypothetical protein
MTIHELIHKNKKTLKYYRSLTNQDKYIKLSRDFLSKSNEFLISSQKFYFGDIDNFYKNQ